MLMLDEQQTMEYVYDKIETNDWYVLVDPRLPDFEVLDRMTFIEQKYYAKHNEDFEVIFDVRKWSIFLFKKNRITPSEQNAVIVDGGVRDPEKDVFLAITKEVKEMHNRHVDFMLAMHDIMTARRTK